ncbi:MAG TPA: hypothetical protein VHS33_13520 [Sphingomicrobium sp.]|jgi:hypothetical protein|nr:hypothetical protein [Sphingomicrobium sp.]
MRKFVIPAFAAASILGAAAPAQAQWGPPAYSYRPYNYGSGFNGSDFARSMQDRVERIRGDIRAMQDRRVLSWSEARSLDHEASKVQDRIFRASRNGIQPGEARRLENDIRKLEYRVSREANDRNNRPDYRRY